jgi:hypothetical protein
MDQYRDIVINEMAKSGDNINKIIKKRASEIIAASLLFKSNDFTFSDNSIVKKKVNDIVDKLKDDIYTSIYGMAEKAAKTACDKEGYEYDSKVLSAFLALKIGNNTLDERISYYISNFTTEIEAFISVGIKNGLKSLNILNLWELNKKKPFEFSLIKDNVGKLSAKGFSKYRYYGKGIESSSFLGLKEVETNNTYQAYNYMLSTIWKDKGVKGWYTERGSNYPCPICDDEVGIIHPMTDYFFGYHLRCCCVMVEMQGENG